MTQNEFAEGRDKILIIIIDSNPYKADLSQAAMSYLRIIINIIYVTAAVAMRPKERNV